VDEVEHVQC
jgi:uridine kinase